MSIQYTHTPSIGYVDTLGSKLSVMAILSAEFCERLGYYAIMSSLTIFLRRKLHYTTSAASIYSTIAGGIGILFSLLGGFLSDSCLGRKRTLLFGALIALVGLIVISLVTIKIDSSHGGNVAILGIIFWIGWYIKTFGTGGIKATVGPFGGEQVEHLVKSQMNQKQLMDPNMVELKTENALESYWLYFYLIINIGALIAATVVAYICQEISFSIGYSIPAVTMVLVIIVYVSRYNKYYVDTSHADENSLFIDFFKITIYGIKHRKENRNDINRHWLDNAKKEKGGLWDSNIVNDVKSVYSIFPFLASNLVYWTLYANMTSIYISQGCQMNYELKHFNIPIPAMNDADTLTVITSVFLFDWFLYPYLKRKNLNFSMLKRIGAGYFVILLANITSAIIEIIRKRSTVLDSNSTCNNEINISSLSILWQIPQYALVGLSEVFTSITSLEFFAGQSPKSLKSVIYALNLCINGFGLLTSSLLVFIVGLWKPKWISNDLNDGYLEYFFILCAGIMAINLIIFMFIAKKYKYKPGTNTSTFHMDNAYKNINDNNNA